MESHSDGNGNDTKPETSVVSAIKTLRTELESRIEAQRSTRLDLLSSLQTLVPNIVSSVDLSLQVVCSFNGNPFTPTPPLPNSTGDGGKPPPVEIKHHNKLSISKFPTAAAIRDVGEDDDDDKLGDGESPLSVVRVMVAECLLQRVPFDPIDSSTVLRKLENDKNVTAAEKAALREVGGESGAILAVEMALRSMGEENRGVELEEFVVSGKSRVMVLNIDRNKLVKELPESAELEFSNSGRELSHNINQGGGNGNGDANYGHMWMGGGMLGPRGGMFMGPRGGMMQSPPMAPILKRQRTEEDDQKDVEALINKKSFKELQKSKTGEELLDLIHRPTAKEIAMAAKFKTKGGSQLKEYCTALTKEDCRRQSGTFMACEKVHFRRIIAPHTDISQGDCSFLDTCRHMKTCKYVHYELDLTADVPPMMIGSGNLAPPKPLKPQRAEYCSEVELGEPQWINCDIRSFKMEILGQFGVIMADPPWDIHMELPYGTMADDEMRTLNVPVLQTDGLIFLWVTGRAMELGRECLDMWGYKRVEEIIWVKTNQLQRIIRTGRTGHWLNHSKEHCLVGIKGNPDVNRNIDTDVLVAEVRETSRKPDEMYSLLERISPRTRKLELFARMHNTQAGWMSMGNQLDGVRLVDEGLRARFKAAYPDVVVQPASPPRPSAMEIDSAPFGDHTSSAPQAGYSADEKHIAAGSAMAAA